MQWRRRKILLERQIVVFRITLKDNCVEISKSGDNPGDCEKMATTKATSSALRALAVEYKSLQEEPVEGFCVKLVNDDNLFEWEVAIFGPPDTLYMGGCFKVNHIFVSSPLSFKINYQRNSNLTQHIEMNKITG